MYNQIMNKSFELLNNHKKERMAMYIIVSLSIGLKVNDVLKIKWEDIRKRYIELGNKKVMFNDNVMRALKIIDKGERGPIFISQKKTVFSIEHINRSLKEFGEGITTHGLRIIFGRHYIESHNEKDLALRQVSKHFNHIDIDMTRIYLGLEIKTLDEWDVYNVVDRKEYTIEEIEKFKEIIPTRKKGVYFLYDKNKILVYVGKTVTCIKQRIHSHLKEVPSKYLTEKEKNWHLNKRGGYKYFSYLPMEDSQEIDSKEIELITKYKPVYNKEYIYKV
jgi:hypothetical protein